jgi:hypothetical protein
MLMGVPRRAPELLQTITRRTRLPLSAAGSPRAALSPYIRDKKSGDIDGAEGVWHAEKP